MSSGSSGHELFVGQKVICVTESWKMGDTGINASGPGLRDIVTIREISNFCGVWLFFEEWPGRVNFDASKFRPIVEPKADIKDEWMRALAETRVEWQAGLLKWRNREPLRWGIEQFVGLGVLLGIGLVVLRVWGLL